MGMGCLETLCKPVSQAIHSIDVKCQGLRLIFCEVNLHDIGLLCWFDSGSPSAKQVTRLM